MGPRRSFGSATGRNRKLVEAWNGGGRETAAGALRRCSGDLRGSDGYQAACCLAGWLMIQLWAWSSSLARSSRSSEPKLSDCFHSSPCLYERLIVTLYHGPFSPSFRQMATSMAPARILWAGFALAVLAV